MVLSSLVKVKVLETPLRKLIQKYLRAKKEGVRIIYSYNLTDDICLVKFSQINGAKLLREIRNLNLDIIHINILLEELTLYIKKDYLKLLTTIIKEKSLQYNLREELTFVRIRFNDPEKIMSNINKTVKILSENMIPYIELGLSLNRLYIILESRYKNDFIKLFEKYEE